MDSVKIVIFLAIVQLGLFSTNGQSQRAFRKDYTYLEGPEAFYKIHTIHRTWAEAKKRCEMEGAKLFYAENEQEANDVLSLWNRTQPFYWVYVGISDLLVKEVFETVDGRPILDVYSKWGPGEPNDAGGIEDCVIMRRDGTLNDDSCVKKNPFICKKPFDELEWSTDCDMPRTDYIYNANLGRCYKFHIDAKNWTEAFAVCSAEQSYLAVINSQSEADYFIMLTAQTNKDKAQGITLFGIAYLGFHNRFGDGWTTVKGQPLESSGYANWGVNQPDGGDNEKCGSMFYNGQLNDVACEHKCFFICEHDINSLTQSVDERFNDLA